MQFDVRSHAAASVGNHSFRHVNAMDILKIARDMAGEASSPTADLKAAFGIQSILPPALGKLLPIASAGVVEVRVRPWIGAVALAALQRDDAKQRISISPSLPFQVRTEQVGTDLTRILLSCRSRQCTLRQCKDCSRDIGRDWLSSAGWTLERKRGKKPRPEGRTT